MTYTDWTWVVVGLELLTVEVFALARGEPPLTASMRHGAERWALWPALFGGLSGHFFGSRVLAAWWAPLCLAACSAVVVWRDLADRSLVARATHLEIFLLFVGLGAALWGSRP